MILATAHSGITVYLHGIFNAGAGFQEDRGGVVLGEGGAAHEHEDADLSESGKQQQQQQRRRRRWRRWWRYRLAILLHTEARGAIEQYMHKIVIKKHC